MMRKLIILTLIQFSLLLSQTQIAVVDFEALGVTNDDARALTNRLMIEMHRTDKFKVLEREMLDKIIEEQKFQLSGCNSDQCLVELGQLANAQQMVGGSVSKVGNVFSVSARLIDVERGEIVRTAIYDYRGDIGDLILNGMREIASQLCASTTQPSVKSEPTYESDQTTKFEDYNTITSTSKIRHLRKPLDINLVGNTKLRKSPNVLSTPILNLNGNTDILVIAYAKDGYWLVEKNQKRGFVFEYFFNKKHRNYKKIMSYKK